MENGQLPSGYPYPNIPGMPPVGYGYPPIPGGPPLPTMDRNGVPMHGSLPGQPASPQFIPGQAPPQQQYAAQPVTYAQQAMPAQQQQVAPDTAGSEQQMPPALDGPPTVDPPFADRLCAEAGAQAATVPLGIPSGLRDAVEAEGGARPCNGASARTVAGANELAGAQLVEVRVGEE